MSHISSFLGFGKKNSLKKIYRYDIKNFTGTSGDYRRYKFSTAHKVNNKILSPIILFGIKKQNPYFGIF